MSCFRRSSGIYVLNTTKKCKPVQEVEYEISEVVDKAPVPPVTTNGNGNITSSAAATTATTTEEPKERRAGIQAPVVKIDENSSSVEKYEKSQE